MRNATITEAEAQRIRLVDQALVSNDARLAAYDVPYLSATR